MNFLCSNEVLKLDEDMWRELFKELDTRTGCKVFVCFMVENGVWGLVQLIQSIIMNLHCHQREIC